MSRFVLDCSVTMGWRFESQASAYADHVMDLFDGEQAIVPSIWSLELANALVIGERRKKISRHEVTRFLRLITELPITIDASTPQRAFGSTLNLARDRNIPVYDAAYLDLAMREGVPLATRDEGLKRAAATVGVELV